MKTTFLNPSRAERLLARFGAALLIKQFDGQVELRGGNRDERQDARDWASLFLHESPCDGGTSRGGMAK